MRPKKIVKLKPKDSAFLRLLKKNPKTYTETFMHYQRPEYRIVDRVRFGELCQLVADGDPRFDTMEKATGEALRLGILEPE